MKSSLSDITKKARQCALDVFGALHEGGDSIVLLGPHEPGFWDIFCASPEAQDGQPDPMDRWSRRVVGALAAKVKATAIFPFDGPPYPPFQAWAEASGQAWPSPVGMLVHERAGLFVSYRGALRLPYHLDLYPPATSPCLKCLSNPCRSACPVNALGPSGYDTKACKDNISGPDSADCRNRGCAARRACPVSHDYGRKEAQSAFHMAHFLQD